MSEPHKSEKQSYKSISIAIVLSAIIISLAILYSAYAFRPIVNVEQNCPPCNITVNCSSCCSVRSLAKEWRWSNDGTITGTASDTLFMYLTQGDQLVPNTNVTIHNGAWKHTWTGLTHGQEYTINYEYSIFENGQWLNGTGHETVTVMCDGNTHTVTNYLDKPTNGQ